MLYLSFSRHSSRFKKQVEKFSIRFSAARKKIIGLPFANLPWQPISQIESLKLPKGFSTLAVVGIGGSSLGAKAITRALNKHSVFYLNNIDPDFVEQKLQRLDPKKTLFLLISKSGETMEILALAHILLDRFPRRNFLVMTDSRASTLGKIAQKYGIPLLISPKELVGRFSALSIVGLLPANFLGVPIHEILEGARGVSWRDAFLLAVYQFIHANEGKNIAVFFPYGERLSALSDWYEQLISESIGKAKKIGITPVKAMGVKDQHSTLQLFLDGPDDKFFIFLKQRNPPLSFLAHRESINLQELFDAEYEGVKEAFKKRGKPFCEISFESLNANNLGALLYFLELEVAFLGALFNINFMNQPAVELSKSITKRILSHQTSSE